MQTQYTLYKQMQTQYTLHKHNTHYTNTIYIIQTQEK